MNELARFIAERLLKIKAVKLQPNNPFVWGTGWQAPVYCDNNKILSSPQLRHMVKVEMTRYVIEHYPDVEVIVGVATNAIAMGMLVAEELGLPFVYVHPTPKDHGFENMIEGDLRPRQQTVIIEDQVSRGLNTIKVVDAIRQGGCEVLGMVSIFNFELAEAKKNFAETELECTSLCGLDAVLYHALEVGLIDSDELKVIKDWQKKPEGWKK